MTAQKFNHEPSYGDLSGHCPFFDAQHGSCRAALLTFLPEGRHLYNYCCSDDHDDCALFLAKALRSSASGGCDRDVAVHCEK